MARRQAAGQAELAALAGWKDEAAYQRHIIRTAKANGWLVFHVPKMRTRTGEWLTNTLLPGWPDLVLIRPPVLMFVEVKGPAGKPTPDQRALMRKLQRIRRVVAAFAHPDDWAALESHLTASEENPDGT